jgi:hypothetical protein
MPNTRITNIPTSCPHGVFTDGTMRYDLVFVEDAPEWMQRTYEVGFGAEPGLTLEQAIERYGTDDIHDWVKPRQLLRWTLTRDRTQAHASGGTAWTGPEDTKAVCKDCAKEV